MESVEEQNNEVEREEKNNQTTNFSWNLLPLLLSVCKETNETLTAIYEYPISLTLYLGTYIIEQNEKQAKELEQYKLKNRNR